MSICVLTAVVAGLSRRPRRAAAALALAMCAWPGLAAAQGARQTPREAVQALIPGSSATDVAAVASAVVTQVASVPLGSSSGGFTFVRDPRTGMLTLKTETFGPSFAERPITLGKAGAFSIGTSYQRTDFDTFEGLSLRTGDLRAELHLDGAPVVDLFSTTLDVTIATTSVAANIGLFDTFDVGVTVPFVRLSFAGMRTSGVPGAGAALVRDVQTSGLGDIQVRAKWAPVQSEHAAMAAAVEVSLPTGDAERLIGTGHWRPRLLFLGSTTSGRLSPHVNLSYRFGGRGAEVRTPAGGFGELLHADVGHELGYTLGLEIAAHPTVTISADLVGRSLRDVARFRLEERGLAAGQGTPELQALYAQLSQVGRASIYSLNARVDSLNRWLLAIGAKTTILRRGLVRFDVMGSLNDEGLRPGLTTVIGMEYTF